MRTDSEQRARLARMEAARVETERHLAIIERQFTIQTTVSITGTSISTPTTVASAAPEWSPKKLMAAATASSKKLDAPISADGPAT